MKYFVAPSFENYIREGAPYKKDGKLYTTVKTKCPRCSGKGIIIARIENGRPIPIPVDSGICYQCLGHKYISKEVRLYTEKEYNTMQKTKEKAQKKKDIERRAKIEKEYDNNRIVWLQTNGFNSETNKTYIYTKNDSYLIKDQLKEAGFRFNGTLKRWMRATNEGYEENTVLFSVDDLVQFSAWGEGHINLDAKEFVDKTLAIDEPVPAFEYDGEIKERITRRVTLVRKGSFMGAFGITNIYTYEDEQHLHQYVWFTATDQPQEVDGSFFTLVGTVKDYKEYKGIHQTYVTRCKITEEGE